MGIPKVTLPSALAESVLVDLLEGINSPYSLSLAMQVRNKTFEPRKVHPSDYIDLSSYRDDVAAEALFKKERDFIFKTDDSIRYDKACASYYENEYLCTRQALSLEPFNYLLERPRKLLKQWLKGFSHQRMKDSVLKFGPGTTYGTSGVNSTLDYKLVTDLTITADCLDLYQELTAGSIMDTNLVDPRPFRIVPGNRFATVSKTYDTDRPICIEPICNMSVQLAIGSELRNCLNKQYSVPFDELPALHHRRLMAHGDALATIDLSNASDTISFALVKALLPEHIYRYIEQSRSPSTRINGHWHTNDKCSSMGNGFTFELESLIFLALARSIDPAATVFGDDIICDAKLAPYLITNLKRFCFVPNMSKTFISGPFKESCGLDVWHNVNVRPVFLRNSPYGKTTVSLRCVYSYLQNIDRFIRNHFIDDDEYVFRNRAFQRILRCIPDTLRFFGPSGRQEFIPAPRRLWKASNKGYILKVKGLAVRPKFRKVCEALSSSDRRIITYALLQGDSRGVLPRNLGNIDCVGNITLPS
ncbi:RNA-directed RNA polymerase [ssRNA phage SRR6960551_6]|uniref:RNA-directed RNA polymerase n=1 Tax=ssRNA phage SRR6960551_6 TaxID=2786557 RepID=A0A8S5L0S5_9VIRU|nr:RNA-directed RNA polymerase [ssRNA phage SRR6960551_6]DAD51039.1 TPA_asm: RNA-directed RNA polymerase [ssRNA phage SRR6960551_6]